ncbi:MAG: choice-of-anchor D domain-containing protein [Candidatus Brocadiales bacterium]|nr:choice-of-anchor D domain-containing protein [Candidatus Brocadiales bacterium]
MEKLVSVIRQGSFLFVLLLLVTWMAGCAPPGNANLVPANATLDFGDVYVGTTKQDTISWTNNGTDPGEIVGLAVNTEKAFTYGGPAFQAMIINPGQSTPNYLINFSPSRTGGHSGRASPGFTGGTHTSIRLRGNGVTQKAVGALSVTGGDMVAGQALDFGNVLVGGNATRTFNIQNNSPNAIAVNASWSGGNRGFTVTAPGNSFNVPAATATTPGSVAVTITFAPPAVGTFTDAVTFSDASGANLAGTVVTGRGVSD